MTDKPEKMDLVFASEAPDKNIMNPDLSISTKTIKGWVAEPPPAQWFNYLQNLIGENTSYINKLGIGVWSDNVTYSLGAYARGSDGFVYSSITDNNINYNPIVSTENWSRIQDQNNVGDELISYNTEQSLIDRGYLLQNGQAVSRVTYSVLFSIIGTTYGDGDGSTTFNVRNDEENQGVSYVKAL